MGLLIITWDYHLLLAGDLRFLSGEASKHREKLRTKTGKMFTASVQKVDHEGLTAKH
jgi:hypothetical protein